jgi:hypothetical protein
MWFQRVIETTRGGDSISDSPSQTESHGWSTQNLAAPDKPEEFQRVRLRGRVRTCRPRITKADRERMNSEKDERERLARMGDQLQQSQGAQQSQHESQSSPIIYFHHWQPPTTETMNSEEHERERLAQMGDQLQQSKGAQQPQHESQTSPSICFHHWQPPTTKRDMKRAISANGRSVAAIKRCSTTAA